MDVALFRPARVNKVLANLVGNLAEIDEAVADVDQLWRSVGSESGNLDATAFVSDGVDGIDEVFIARNQHRGIVATGQRKHVDGDLNIEVCFARAVVECLQLFLHDAKTIAPHPKQKSLLTFRAGINSGVKESTK